jgi:uncharacterized protein
MDSIYFTLITGASEGLGKFLALECAARRMNLVLVSLPATGLDNFALFIRKNFDVNVEYFETDLSMSGSCSILINEIQTRNLKINILINNVGVGSTGMFEEQTVDFYQKQILLNVMSTTVITRLLIENLQQCAPSYILNVGSLASFFVLPAKQVYGGTKAYIYAFSKALEREFRKKGVKVSVLCPGGINTNVAVTLMNRSMSWASKQSVMNPESVAKIAMCGLLAGRRVIIPGKMNNVFLLLNRIFPQAIKNLIISRSLRMFPQKMVSMC